MLWKPRTTSRYDLLRCGSLPALARGCRQPLAAARWRLAPESRALPPAPAEPGGRQPVLAIGNFFLFFFSLPLPANSSSWRRQRQLCSVPHGSSEMGREEVPHPGGNPCIQAWHLVLARSRPLLRHLRAAPQPTRLPVHFLPEAVVPVPRCGAEQRAGRLCLVFPQRPLWTHQQCQHPADRHEAEDQPSGHSSDAEVQWNWKTVLHCRHSPESPNWLGEVSVRARLRSAPEPEEHYPRCEDPSDRLWRLQRGANWGGLQRIFQLQPQLKQCV